jgi:hypothetical protein
MLKSLVTVGLTRRMAAFFSMPVLSGLTTSPPTATGKSEHRAVSRVRFAPGSRLLPSGEGTGRVTSGDVKLALHAFRGALTREEGQYAPRMGDRLRCEVLALVKGPGREFGYALAPADIPMRTDAGGAQVGDRRVDRWP